MKQICLCIGLWLAYHAAFGQNYSYWNRCGDVFNPGAYPTDTFSSKHQAFDWGKSRIVITILRHKFLQEDQVWVQQTFNGNPFRSKYLGGIGNESGVAVPAEQPLPGYFLFYAAGEFTGTFYLISENGFWFQLPGGELFIDQARTRLYTQTPAECGKCRVGTFDLKTEELITRWSDGNTHPWPQFAGQTFALWWIKDEDWVGW
jgi:hypothetical protein